MICGSFKSHLLTGEWASDKINPLESSSFHIDNFHLYSVRRPLPTPVQKQKKTKQQNQKKKKKKKKPTASNQEIWGSVICFCICPGNLFDSENTNHLKEESKKCTISFVSMSILRLDLLRLCSTDPYSLGLKELAHTVISWFEFLPCSPADSSAEQARKWCQWCPP